ncbi:MAG: hypothetical protein OQL08_05955 [Gammaproteobacteria bacterium]|nr:hypothetical protein [Gammaproteobacteria bacterium]
MSGTGGLPSRGRMRLLLLACLVPAMACADAQQPAACRPDDTTCSWTRQLTDNDLGQSPTLRDMAVDPAGNLYLAGETYPETGFGQSATLLAKFDADGRRLWVRRLVADGGGFNMAYGIDVDAKGNICLAGITDGAFGAGKARRRDGFVARYDTDGHPLWAINTASATAFAAGLDDKGNCHTAALTEVTKYDPTGKRLWTYRTPVGAMAVGGNGRVYLVGQADNAPEPYLMILDGNGKALYQETLRLGRNFGWNQPDFHNPALAIDAQGAIYLQATMSEYGRSGALRVEAFLAKLDSTGKILWERHHGSAGHRWDSFYVAVDGPGNAYLVGRTMTFPVASPGDVFVIKYDTDGELQWARQFGTPLFDGAARIALDRNGNHYIGGATEGDLTGQGDTVRRIAVPFIARNRP